MQGLFGGPTASLPVTSTGQGSRCSGVLFGVPRAGELWAGLTRAGWSLQNRSRCSGAHVGRWPGSAGALVISSISLLRPNSRAVKDSEIVLLLFPDRTEIGPWCWRCARIREKSESAWDQGSPVHSRGVPRPVPLSKTCVLACVFGGWGGAIHVLPQKLEFIPTHSHPFPTLCSDLRPTFTRSSLANLSNKLSS